MRITIETPFEAVREQTDKAIAAGAAPFDPTLPLYQWQAIQALAVLGSQFSDGDQYALMLAIRKCAQCGLPMPEWVRSGYILAFDTVHTHRAKSWDEVFGEPFPKGKQLHAARRDLSLRWEILERVRELRSSMPIDDRKAIDEEMFSLIGKELGASKTKVSDLYYSFSESMRALP